LSQPALAHAWSARRARAATPIGVIAFLDRVTRYCSRGVPLALQPRNVRLASNAHVAMSLAIAFLLFGLVA